MEIKYVLDITKPYDNVLMMYGDYYQVQRYTRGIDTISVDQWELENPNNGWIPDTTGTNLEGEPERLYYLQDEMGSTTKVIGEDGKTSAHYNYDEFGRPLSFKKFDQNWPGPDNTFGYTGYQYDVYAGLWYAQARYYDPQVGRFISEDSYRGDANDPLSLNLYSYCQNNPLKYVDPMGFWSIWVQKYDGGNTYLSVEFNDSKILSTMEAAVNALPFGSAFDYSGRIEDLAGVITSTTDGFGGLESMYKYKPDNELLERIKKWDTIAPTVNDILDKTKAYESVAEKLTSNAAKNIVKNAAVVITAGFGLYDAKVRADNVDKDKYLRGMIRAADLEDTLENTDNPADAYILMTFIESKLNSYGSENYKLFNKYFGDSYFGLNDYTIEPSWWDKLWGNEKKVMEDIENARDFLNSLADRLRRDFDSATKCE